MRANNKMMHYNQKNSQEQMGKRQDIGVHYKYMFLLLVFSYFQTIICKDAQIIFCNRAVKTELKLKAVSCQLFTSAETIGTFSGQSPRFSCFPEPNKYTMLARMRKLLLFCQKQLLKFQRVAQLSSNTSNTIEVHC